MIPKLRLLVTSVFFAAWIGYLVYLVSITRNPVILSRPQFLVADVYVLAELDGGDSSPNAVVKVREVAWPKDPSQQQLVGKDITVENLNECKKANGWVGKGEYVLPLTRMKVPVPGNGKMQFVDKYKLTEIPESPGFHQYKQKLNYLLIYSDTAQAHDQLTQLIAEFHGGKD